MNTAAAQVADAAGPPPATSAANPVAEPGEGTTPLGPTSAYAPKGLPGVKAAGGRTARAQGVQALAAPAVNFLYSSASQFAVSDGTQATITIAKPILEAEDFHSLAEVAVQSADGRQIVEVGWTVDRKVNGDDKPHLFVYHWVDRKETCYNVCGFVPYGSATKPGAVLPIGDDKLFAIKHFGNAWWINYDNVWIGYYPDSLWGGKFTRTGLTQWFGEVAAADATPCTDMGNGKAASSKNAAAITGIGFFEGPAPAIAAGATSIYYSVAAATKDAYRFGGKGAC